MQDRTADRHAITEVMYRYARATDWNDPEGHREVFVPDCVFASPHSGDVTGIDSVVAWMEEKLALFDASQHLIGNISITFTSDDTADAVSYVQAWHRFLQPDRPDLFLWGEYHDHWVRLDGRWWVSERRVLEAGTTPQMREGVRNPRRR